MHYRRWPSVFHLTLLELQMSTEEFLVRDSSRSRKSIINTVDHAVIAGNCLEFDSRNSCS